MAASSSSLLCLSAVLLLLSGVWQSYAIVDLTSLSFRSQLQRLPLSLPVFVLSNKLNSSRYSVRSALRDVENSRRTSGVYLYEIFGTANFLPQSQACANGKRTAWHSPGAAFGKTEKNQSKFRSLEEIKNKMMASATRMRPILVVSIYSEISTKQVTYVKCWIRQGSPGRLIIVSKVKNQGVAAFHVTDSNVPAAGRSLGRWRNRTAEDAVYRTEESSYQRPKTILDVVKPYDSENSYQKPKTVDVKPYATENSYQKPKFLDVKPYAAGNSFQKPKTLDVKPYATENLYQKPKFLDVKPYAAGNSFQKPKTLDVKPYAAENSYQKPKTVDVKPYATENSYQKPKTVDVKPYVTENSYQKPKTVDVKPYVTENSYQKPKSLDVKLYAAENSDQTPKSSDVKPYATENPYQKPKTTSGVVLNMNTTESSSQKPTAEENKPETDPEDGRGTEFWVSSGFLSNKNSRLLTKRSSSTPDTTTRKLRSVPEDDDDYGEDCGAVCAFSFAQSRKNVDGRNNNPGSSFQPTEPQPSQKQRGGGETSGSTIVVNSADIFSHRNGQGIDVHTEQSGLDDEQESSGDSGEPAFVSPEEEEEDYEEQNFLNNFHTTPRPNVYKPDLKFTPFYPSLDNKIPNRNEPEETPIFYDSNHDTNVGGSSSIWNSISNGFEKTKNKVKKVYGKVKNATQDSIRKVKHKLNNWKESFKKFINVF